MFVYIVWCIYVKNVKNVFFVVGCRVGGDKNESEKRGGGGMGWLRTAKIQKLRSFNNQY